MRRHALLLFGIISIFAIFLLSVPTNMALSGWSRTYVGESMDILTPVSLIQTSDGGYATLIYGYLRRVDNVGFQGHFSQFYELQILKTNSIGEIQWRQNFSQIDDPNHITPSFFIDSMAYAIVQTEDRGFVIAGSGTSMFWMFKVNSQGAILWSKTYVYNEEVSVACNLYSMIQTNDGGFVLAGSTETFEGGLDFWLIKTDANGVAQWNQTYNSGTYRNSAGDEYPCQDEAKSVVQTRDGGYALVGSNSLYRVSTSSLVYASWLIKTDAQGKPLWNKGYDSPNDNARIYSIIQTADDGYAITGTQNDDFYLIKVDSVGKHQWNKTYGESLTDTPCALFQLDDGGYALGGTWTKINTTASASSLGILRLDSSGELIWIKTYNAKESSTTISFDLVGAMIRTSDGSYAIVGSTLFGSEYHQDVFFVKTETVEQPPQPTQTSTISSSPSVTETPITTPSYSTTISPIPTPASSNPNPTPTSSIPEIPFWQITIILVTTVVLLSLGKKLRLKSIYN